MAPGNCKFEGCHGSARTHGLCRSHYWQERAGKALTPITKFERRRHLAHPEIAGALLVPLTKGQFAIIDERDSETVGKYNWCVTGSLYAKSYIRMSDGSKKLESLHRFLWDIAWGLSATPEIDHRNRNPLDCRRENLRPATRAQNIRNRDKQQNNRAGAKGVTYDKRRGTWFARIMVDGKTKHLGSFSSATNAADAYLKAAKELHGDFAGIQ